MNLFDLAAKITLDSSEYEKGLNDASGKASGFGNKLKTAAKVGAAAIGAATTAVVGFTKESVGVGMKFDSSMSQVAATMGKTVDEIANLRDFALEMGSTTAFSASQAADALNYMALAGYDAETSMNMLPNVLNLAAAGGIELAYASDMVTDASSALGLNLDETAALVDKMAKASSKSNTSVSQLGEAILTVGGTAKNLAGGTTELSTALGILADNGIKGSEGGTALRNILLSLTPKSEDAANAMEAIGLQAYDANGEMRSLNDIFTEMNAAMSDMSTEERQNILSNIFNKVDLKSVNALMSAASYNMDALSDAIQQSGISWDKYEDNQMLAVYGMEGLIDGLKNQIASGWDYSQMVDMVQTWGFEAADAKTLVDAATKSISENGNRWSELTGYIDDATGAASAMAETQLDNLAGDITLFQSALEGAQIAISDDVTPTLRQFVQFGSNAISTLSTAFQEGGLSGAMGALGTILSDGISLIISELPTFIEAGMSMLKSLTTGILQNLPLMLSTAIEIIGTLARGIANDLPALIPTIVDVVLQIVDTLTDPDTLSNLVDAAIEIIIALADGLILSSGKLIAKAPEIVWNLVKALIENAPKLLNAADEILNKLNAGIAQGFVYMLKIGGNLVAGLWQGLSNSMTWLKNKIKGWVGNVMDFVKNLFGIHSPSKVFANIGEMLDRGLAKGIDDYANVAIAATEGMANDVLSAMSDYDGNLSTTFTAAGAGGSSQYGKSNNSFVLNIYGSEGQSVRELADEVMSRIQYLTEQRRAVFA